MWPEVELYEARVPRAPRDLILLVGDEPSFRWRTFSKVIVELAEALGTQLVVTLGALLADVPHTRPISVTGLASDSALVARLGLTRSSYEGPTGIVGVLHAACQESGLPSASLWAAVPHYIAAAPNPKAALALVRKLEGLVRWRSTPPSSSRRPPTTSARSTSPCRATPTSQAFVERLEQAAGDEAERGRAAALRRHDRPRPPAVPAPARRRRPPPDSRPRRAQPTGWGYRSAAGHTSR